MVIPPRAEKGGCAMKDYTLIHNWDEKLSAEEQMQAAAIVARTLTYLIDGLGASGCAWNDDDIGIIKAHAAYLANLTHGFLPSRRPQTAATPVDQASAPDPTPSDLSTEHGVIDLNAWRRDQEGA